MAENRYVVLDEIYKGLRMRGYSGEETIRWMTRHKILTPNRQQLHSSITLKKLKDILREVRKEYKIYG